MNTLISKLGARRPLAAAAAAVTLALAGGPAVAGTDAFEQLPTQEILGRQIGWYVNNTLDAMTAAVESNRALVIVFGDDTSSFTQAFARYVASCPQLGQLAGAAVFAYGSPTKDEFARRMALHLKLTDYPTISVIAPRTDKLTEVHRLEGFFDAQSAARFLRGAIVAKGFWPASAAAPKPLPGHYLAYPGMACTWEGARRLGIVRADTPAP